MSNSETLKQMTSQCTRVQQHDSHLAADGRSAAADDVTVAVKATDVVPGGVTLERRALRHQLVHEHTERVAVHLQTETRRSDIYHHGIMLHILHSDVGVCRKNSDIHSHAKNYESQLAPFQCTSLHPCAV